MNYWLMKSEPSVFSFEDMKKAGTTCWNGVRNYQARNFMRDDMKKGDLVLFYHSNTDEPHVAGLCEIISDGYPDYTAFDPESENYDPRTSEEKPAWYMVDVKYKQDLRRSVTLNEIKNNEKLQNMKLVQKGNRLSVTPLTGAEFDEILRMGGM